MHILLICAGQTYKAVSEAFLHALRLSEDPEIELTIVSNGVKLALELFPDLKRTQTKLISAELDNPFELGPPFRAGSCVTIAKRNAARIAAAVANSKFDKVEVSDTCLVGPYLKPALNFYQVGWKHIVLALKGGKSSVNLGLLEGVHQELELLLNQQFEAADHHYSLDPAMGDDNHLGKTISLIDPWSQLPSRPQNPLHHGASKPVGPVTIHLHDPTNPVSFEAIRWLPVHKSADDRLRFRTTFTCEDQSPSRNLITQQAAARDLSSEEAPKSPFKDAVNRLKSNSLVLATRHHASIDLTLLNYVEAGVPVLMAKGSPTANFLCGSKIGHLIHVFDPTHAEDCADALVSVLENWESKSRDAAEAANLLSQGMTSGSPLAYYRTIQSAVSSDPAKEEREAFEHYVRLEANWLNVLKKQARHFITRLPPEAPLRRAARKARSILAPKSERHQFETHLTRLGAIDETNLHEFDRSLLQSDGDLGYAKGRCKVWAELARLERACGNRLTAAAYDIRIMRAANADPYGRLPLVQDALSAANLAHIAKSLPLLVSQEPKYALEDSVPPIEPKQDEATSARFEIFDDRIGQIRKVAIIVSLYKVSQDRLLSFLKLLGRQTLVQQGQVELILVDAGDSAGSRDLVKALDSQLGTGLVYAKSARRVTIQAAWNEGIKLARAPYLCFLGVDEALYPTALEELSQKLDRSPSLDWVMASSLVTEVNDKGQLIRDKTFFDRGDVSADTTYLETCSVSWVGGMYRRAIHDRVGTYDSRFYAAGDTEFKMRTLGALNVGFIQKTLGVFRDYPEARASGGVLAELEDSLAWYAYRSMGGASFTFRNVSNERLEHLIHQCGGYRKCFSQSASTDVNLGFVLCHVLALRQSAMPGLPKLKDFFQERILEFRDYDFGGPFEPHAESQSANASRLSRINKQFKDLTGVEGQFFGLNDNRYEQHNWVWPAGAEPNPFNPNEGR
jgi:glycosyltransferase involved in cell wall biosynthesis